MSKFKDQEPVHIKKNFISQDESAKAIEWIKECSYLPSKILEPDFDINDDIRQFAKKIRKLYWHDKEFWSTWFENTGFMKLVKNYIENPVLIKHAAFIKRHADESYIPLHQDIVLWERPFRTAITFWVALTDSLQSNGGMFYYPCISRLFLHELDIKFPSFKCITLDKEFLDPSQFKNINVKSGSVVIWPGSLPHGSHNNISGNLRIGMPFVFIDQSEATKIGGNNVQ
jgi:hypothetical protein